MTLPPPGFKWFFFPDLMSFIVLQHFLSKSVYSLVKLKDISVLFEELFSLQPFNPTDLQCSHDSKRQKKHLV